MPRDHRGGDYTVMVEFGTSAFRGWVRVRVLGYGFRVRGRKVKSRDCALAGDLVRADKLQLGMRFTNVELKVKSGVIPIGIELPMTKIPRMKS